MARRRPLRATTRARPDASDDLAREAWTLVVQLFRALKQRSISEFNLTPAQAQLLASVNPEHPMAMSEVAAMLGCDASNVTGLVDRLEERGLLERRASAEDRRVKMIAVTTDGRREHARLIQLWHEAPPQIRALSERDLRELLRILKKASGT